MRACIQGKKNTCTMANGDDGYTTWRILLLPNPFEWTMKKKDSRRKLWVIAIFIVFSAFNAFRRHRTPSESMSLTQTYTQTKIVVAKSARLLLQWFQNENYAVDLDQKYAETFYNLAIVATGEERKKTELNKWTSTINAIISSDLQSFRDYFRVWKFKWTKNTRTLFCLSFGF